MFIVILLYDQLIFRPLVVWGDRFRFDQEQGGHVPESWALTMLQRSRLMTALRTLFNAIIRWTSRKAPRPQLLLTATATATRVGRRADLLWFALLVLLIALALWRIARMLIGETTWHEAAAGGGSGGADHAARHGADRAREPGVGADRHLGRPAAARDRRSCSRWRSSWRRFRPTCCSRWPSTASSAGNSTPTSGSAR